MFFLICPFTFFFHSNVSLINELQQELQPMNSKHNTTNSQKTINTIVQIKNTLKQNNEDLNTKEKKHSNRLINKQFTND